MREFSCEHEQEGFRGFEYASWYGLFAPAGTSQAILKKVHQAALSALAVPAVLRIYKEQGLNATPTTQEEFAKYVASERRKWADVVREAHIAQM